MGLFGPPNVAKLDAAGKIDGLVRAARYKKDPEVAEAARQALEGYLDRIIQRLDTKNMVQLKTSRDALVLIGPPRATGSSTCFSRATCTGARMPPTFSA